jgi:aspartyl-tRNA(Asn)/glutamyl-tRNA(Gln) amidotransferase subunit B
VRNDVARELKARGQGLAEAIAPARLAAVLTLVENGELSSSGAREVLATIWDTSESPAAAMQRLGLAQVRDESQLASWVSEVLRESPQQAAQYRAGKLQVIGFLVGQVMKRSGGRADPKRIQELVRAALAEESGPAA